MHTKDTVLKQVHAALEHEARIDLQNQRIEVDFDDGTLTLDGEVPNVGCKKRALEAAAAVSGVSGIIDRLHVTPAERLGDGAIRDAVCEHFLSDVDFHNCCLHSRAKGREEVLREMPTDTSGSIDVSVEDGVVTLTGQVISLSHKRLAGLLAWLAPGCRDVVNGLEVVPPEDDNDDEITDALRLVLETDPLVPADRIGIRSHDHVVTLEGVVSTQEEKTRAEQDAWCLFAVDKVINHIEVRI